MVLGGSFIPIPTSVVLGEAFIPIPTSVVLGGAFIPIPTIVVLRGSFYTYTHYCGAKGELLYLYPLLWC